MNKNKEYVGIDMLKDSFDVYYQNDQHRKFSNDEVGFDALVKSLGSVSHCVMEQTGRYHQPLAFYLCENRIKV